MQWRAKSAWNDDDINLSDSSRTYTQSPVSLQNNFKLQTSKRYIQTTTTNFQNNKMSFSNTDTGSKPADPYKAKNQENELPLKEKVDGLIELIDKNKFGMMTTRASNGLLVSRAMAVAAKESGGIDLIFHTNTESGKTDDLDADAHINIAFIDPSGQWASISGTATIETDRSVIKKYYSSSLKAWVGDLGDGVHNGGPEDPRIGVIKVKSSTITYAVTNQSFVSRAAEVAKGMVTGSAASVNSLREISEAELQKWRTANN